MKSKFRIGQDIFNFLQWLNTKKGYDNKESMRMADPFNISDKEWNKLYKEYNDEEREL